MKKSKLSSYENELDNFNEMTSKGSIQNIEFRSPVRPHKRPNVPNSSMLDQKARDIQCQLSERGKYVTWKEIIYELIRNYEHCSHIGDLGLYQADQLQTIKDLIRLQMRIDIFIILYESKFLVFYYLK